MNKETKDGKEIHNPHICPTCGRMLEPALHMKNFVTNEYDGHSWFCKYHPNLILSIG